MGSSNYFYTCDHLASVRVVTDSTGSVQGEFQFDPFGRVTQTAGTVSPDFEYADTYHHARSGFHLAMYRVYNSASASFLNRDPLNAPGQHTYNYAFQNPISNRDTSGLSPETFIVWHQVMNTGSYHGNIVTVDGDQFTVYAGRASGGFPITHFGGGLHIGISSGSGGWPGYSALFPGGYTIQPVSPGPGTSPAELASNLSVLAHANHGYWGYWTIGNNSNSIAYTLLRLSGAIIPKPIKPAPGFGDLIPMGWPEGDYPPQDDCGGQPYKPGPTNQPWNPGNQPTLRNYPWPVQWGLV
ncbi:MAG TPA: RHS repeat-associated core domain-containing protein [Oculatellaceae cyanobacterium]